jgi:hypothetical protein
MNRALWIVQGLLAALFAFGGAAKLMMPAEAFAELPLSYSFILFIGVCEVLGALGLILPGVTGIRRGLTPLAASGLVIIMIGATALTAAGVGGGDAVSALFPGVTGVLAAFVAYGRSRPAPRRQAVRVSTRPAVLRQAA